jgi:hypothetical protein
LGIVDLNHIDQGLQMQVNEISSSIAAAIEEQGAPEEIAHRAQEAVFGTNRASQNISSGATATAHNVSARA